MRKTVIVSVGAVTLLAVGLLTGWALPIDAVSRLAFPRDGITPEVHTEGDEDPHAHDGERAHDDEMVALSEQAYSNLGLQLGTVALSDYYRVIRIPGVVMEKPGHSTYALAAPLHGIVTRVHVMPGQAVRDGDVLFDLQVVDESLAEAQLELLETLTRLEIADAELARLKPLADAGTVLGRKMLELQYERKELEAKRVMRLQELAIRGLDEKQIDVIVRDRELLREIKVRMPRTVQPDALVMEDDAVSSQGSHKKRLASGTTSDGMDYTVEHIKVFPGQTVRRGDDLCRLAYHTVLFLKGQAFESDLDGISQLEPRGWSVTAEFGMEGHEFLREGLDVLFVDNHVDPETQTFLFYVPLANEVVKDGGDSQGRTYRSWRFKPGQRVHLLVPVQKFERQQKLPAAAVVREGPDAFVFRVHEHADETEHEHEDHAHGPEASHDHPHDYAHDDAEVHDHDDDVFIELERIPVRVKYEDSQFTVIEGDGQLAPGDVIAMNSAYQLQMSLKVRDGGGAGHGHDHGHEH